MRKVVALIAVAGAAAAFVTFLFGCSGFSVTASTCGACRFIYDYQSLLAGGVAVGAALFALIPVYDQLQLSRLQSAVMSRDVLVKRLTTTEARRNAALRQSKSMTSDLESILFPGDADVPAAVVPEWAFHSESIVADAMAKLEATQQSQSDPTQVNAVRSKVIAAANDLKECLYLIPLPARTPWDDVELGLTHVQQEAAATKADLEAKAAERDLPTRISAVRKAANELDGAYDIVLGTLRARLRKIDDFILERDI
jgi:hypothetical protein